MERIDLLKSKKIKNFLLNRLVSSWLGFIVFVVVIFGIISSIVLYFGINNFLIRLIILGISILAWFLFFLYKNYFYIPKNDKDSEGIPKMFGIVIAIDDNGEFEGYKIKQDFLEKLRDQLDNKLFKIIELSNRKSRSIINMDEEEKKNLNSNKIEGHYWIYGKTEQLKDGKEKCYIKTDACVFHANVPNNVKKELSLDFDSIYPKEISFEEDWYKSGITFSGDYNAIVVKYIIGVACLISGAPLAAWNIHKNLHLQLNNIPKKENVETTFNEEYTKLLAEKIKIIQYAELGRICDYFYQKKEIEKRKSWLLEWELLSETYKFEDANLLNQKGIYEFLINKNISLSKSFIKKSAKLGNKGSRYSIVFLHLWNKQYGEAKNGMKRILRKDFTNEIIAINSTISFMDDLINEYPDRFEFLYWQALLYFYKKANIPMAFGKIEEYINKCGDINMGYELENPKQMKIKIEKEMKIEQF